LPVSLLWRLATPHAWAAQLDAMRQWDIEAFVPGHGPLGTKADLALQKQYIQVLDQSIARVIQAGKTVEDALPQPLPPPFDAWAASGMKHFETNVRSAYKRLSDH
jgi:hypothetical protein